MAARGVASLPENVGYETSDSGDAICKAAVANRIFIKIFVKYIRNMSLNVWTSLEDTILINFVKNHDALYNVKNKGYRSGLLKQKLWSQIGKLLNKKDSDCSKRWCYVRDYYIRRRGKHGVVTTGEVAKNRAELLAFLDNIPTSKYEISVDVTQDVVQEQKSQNFVVCYDDPEDVPLKKMKLSQSEETELPREIVELTQKEYDENDLFFNSMAKIVKRLPRFEQVKLRIEIGALVGNTELRCIANDFSSDEHLPKSESNVRQEVTVKVEHLD